MQSPSAQCLINSVDIYSAVLGRDRDGGYQPTYPSKTYSAVPCSAQQKGIAEVSDQDRITEVQLWRIMFGFPFPVVKARDKILYVDFAGTTHTLFVDSSQDNAGRGAALTIQCTERV